MIFPLIFGTYAYLFSKAISIICIILRFGPCKKREEEREHRRRKNSREGKCSVVIGSIMSD